MNRLARTAGLAFIVIGVVSNEWVLALLFSPDRHLIPPTRMIIAMFDLFCLTVGYLTFKRRSFRLLGKISLFFATPFCALFLLETAMSFSHRDDYRPNPTGSFRLIPNNKTEGRETNSFGMHWREVTRQNPSNKTRIAFLGDSFTFGCCAHGIGSSFVGIFDSKFRSNKIEVLNFGVPGYGIADIYLQLKEDVIPFHPSYVILMFFSGNDFQDTYFAADGNRIRGSERFKTYRDMIPAPFLGTPYERVLTHVRELNVYRLFLRAKDRIRNRGGSKVTRVQDYAFTPGLIFSSPQFFCRLRYPPVAVRAKDLSLQYLQRIDEFCKKNEIKLMIMSLPFDAQVYSRSISGPDFNIGYPQKYVEIFSLQHSIPYVDALPGFREYVFEHHTQLFSSDGHYNDEGHRVFAEILIQFFMKNTNLYRP